MGRDDFDPKQMPGYAADEPQPAADAKGPPIRTGPQDAAANRGQRAPRTGSGVVIGSGAGAGGGNTAEDFDQDSASGSQSQP